MFKRLEENPILKPNNAASWEALAAFNPCVVKGNKKYHMLYRAQSLPQEYHGEQMSVSSIGYAESTDGIHFDQRRQLIKPEQPWEKFGCEDPRVTKLGDKYYIFYTALSFYPFSAPGIKIGLAITKDFQTIEEKHLVTNFNSKAMALFPEKINGKFVAVLTAHTDQPPAKIGLAFFDKEEELWSEHYWTDWHSSLDSHVLPLLRNSNDHIEIGAPPIKTAKGWVFIYSYIQNYFSSQKIFGIEAVLLDLKNPAKVIGRTTKPLLVPEKEYELKGDVPNVIFPSGALLEQEKLSFYYGAADTTGCMATANVNDLIAALTPKEKFIFETSKNIAKGFQRYQGNPLITPRPEFAWEAKATFNPAAIYEDGKVHIIYRAMSHDDTSVFGYASSVDGIHIDERLSMPIYVPRASFEQKLRPGNSGCEDPRLTKLDNRFYMFYTAFDGYIPRVAFTSISVKDFLAKRWNWEMPIVITPPGIDDKDSCLLSKKINGKYVIFHRAQENMRINFVESLAFKENQLLEHSGYLIKPMKEYWDNRKFGISPPPLATKKGWLLLFHRVTKPESIYKVEALLLDIDNPTKVIAETDATLFEPETDYEKIGQISNVVFPCGAVLLKNEIFLYYGGADEVVGVAKMRLKDVLKQLEI